MLRNHCAQRALARATGIPVERVHAEHPPDTPFALLGTTPWRLARAARAYGLEGRAQSSRRPRPLPPAPFAALVNLRAWGRRLPEAHWVLVTAHDASSVRCADEGTVPLDRFLRAWRGYPVPGYRHASVTLSALGKADPPRAAMPTP